MYDPFRPYVSENIGHEPVLIESRSQRRKLLKEKGLEILPEKKHKYTIYGKDYKFYPVNISFKNGKVVH